MNRSPQPRKSLRRTLVLSLAIAAVGAPAYAANFPFVHRRGAIPDLDQRRESTGGNYGLPGDGRNHCVPTSAMNLLAYISNHGYGWMEPLGPRNWQNQNLYNSAGIEIWKMGEWFMSTDPNRGTTGRNHVKGLQDWFESWGLSSDFTVTGHFADKNYCPSPNEIADAALSGDLVMVVVGWYANPMGTTFNRAGGHSLTMNRIAGDAAGTYTISWRDPASDNGSWTTQSPFSRESYTLAAVSGTFDGFSRTQWRVNGFSSSLGGGYIDGYVVITPKFAITTSRLEDEFVIEKLSLFAEGWTRPHRIAALGGIKSAALHPANSRVAYLTQPDGENWSDLLVLDPLTAETREVASNISDVAEVVVSRGRWAYVLCDYGQTVRAYTLDESPLDPLWAHTPQSLNTLAYDDRRDRLIVVGTANQRMVEFLPDLSAWSDIQLPGGLSINPEAAVCVSPVDSHIWIASTWAAALYELAVDEFGVAALVNTVEDPELAAARDLSIDDRNHLFVSTTANTGLEFGPDGGSGFQRISPSILDGLEIGSTLQVTWRRDSFNPDTMNTEAYDNILPEEWAPAEIDYPGDLNCDGVVDFADINPFVLALSDPASYALEYAECDIANGDVNLDGIVDFADINAFVAVLTGQ